MADYTERSLDRAISLLTKISTCVCEKKDKPSTVDKITKTGNEPADQSKKTNDNLQKLISLQQDSSERQKEKDERDRKPEQIVQKQQEVIISSFGRKADDELSRAFKKSQPQEKQVMQEQKAGAWSWLSKLFGPGILAVLGVIAGLGGLISGILKGDFGKLIEDWKKGDMKSLKKDAWKLGYGIIQPVLHSLPVIGPVLSFWDAYEDFQKGNGISGINNMIQGIVGLFGVPMSTQIKLYGGMNIVESLIERKYGTETVPKNVGGNLLASMLKSTRLIFSSFLKAGTTTGKVTAEVLRANPMLRALPVIGTLLNFGAAALFFASGSKTTSGWVQAMMNIASGISGLFPGIGTAISIGLDLVNALVFTTRTNEKGEEEVTTRDWVGQITNWSKEVYRKVLKGLKNLLPGFMSELITINADGSVSITPENMLGSWKDYIMDKLDPLIGMHPSKTPEQVKKELDSTVDLKAKAQVLRKNALLQLKAYSSLMYGKDFKDEDFSEDDIQKEIQSLQTDQNKLENKNTIKAKDFIKTPDGKIIQPANNDTTVGFQPGGPLDKFFDKNYKLANENNTILKNLTKATNDLLQQQIDILQSSNKHLAQIKANYKPNVDITYSTYNNSSNNSNFGDLRTLQGVS